MKWLDEARGRLGHLFGDQPIVLVDVGASGEPPKAWRDLAPLATYVGFDPDLRELRESNEYGFTRFVMVDKAVTPEPVESVEFHLTASPYCSSVLMPDFEVLTEYSFTELFVVERTATVAATTLREALEAAGVNRIDWIKLDTQGIDLDIISAMAAPLRDGLLAVDIEPGVAAFYHGENTFTQAHEYLLQHGFWLADAHLQRYPKVAQVTRERLAACDIDYSLLPASPTAIEALYYCTRSHLARMESPRNLACAWVIAMLNAHYGFALDVAVAFAERTPGDPLGDWILSATLETMGASPRVRSLKLRRAVYSWVPEGLRPVARRMRSAMKRR